jgi:hypothetical protein
MAFGPADLYANFELKVSTIGDLNEVLETLYARRLSKPSTTWVYRGVADADHGFLSSLQRRVWWTQAAKPERPGTSVKPPNESEISEAEGQILADAHRWGLHDGQRGRLSVLGQLAMLQHNHAPTRLIDVSFNIWIALWFAAEAHFDNGAEAEETKDGRLFVIDISQRLINEIDGERGWADEHSRPWTGVRDWCDTARAWRPPPAERRIAAQHGGFLFGGIPRTTSVKRYPKSTASGTTGEWLTQDELRSCTSLPLRFHKVDPKTGFKESSAGSAFTIRIAKNLKPVLRKRLQQLHGFTTGTIYPDISGFGRFGTPQLIERP